MSSRIPKLNRGVDVFSLPLSTKEGFVLSRIDGASSVEDISMMVGVKVNDLLGVLDRLADLGAVQLSWRAAAAPPPPPPAAEAPRGEDHPAAKRVLATPVVPLFTESELHQPGDLTQEQKRRILNGYYGLEGKDYYQLLGIARNADKKEVRAAYFELSRLFHPDSMFGRDLGGFRVKMETVFKRLTEAYEVLGRKPRRAEYDEYLASTATTTAMQDKLDRVDSEVRALSTAPPRGDVDPRQSSEPAREASRRSMAPPPPASPSEEPKLRDSSVGVRPPASIEERKAHARERLRRSFSGAGPAGNPLPPPTPQPAIAQPAIAQPSASQPSASQPSASQPSAAKRGSLPPAPGPAAERRDSAIKGLRQSLRQSSTGMGGVEPVLAHLRRAKDAEQAGDLLAAAASLQAALTLQPNHKDIQSQYERVSKAVTRNLADNYEKQARYEEKQGKWAAAAMSWERVSEGRPEHVEAARAVAEALLKASGDMHKAQRYAQRAVDTAPSDPANVVTLARVLLAAGLRVNARRELEKAVKLDPQNEMIKNLLREAR